MAEGSTEEAVSYEDEKEIARLQARLLPLVAAETSIASELNGGFTGRASSYVRTGWQTWVNSGRPTSDSTISSASDVTSMVASILQHAQDDIEALWRHPLVSKMANLRKLGLEDTSPL